MNTERLEEESNVTQGVAVTEPVMKVKKKIDEDQIEERVMEVFDRVFGERLAEAMTSRKEESEEEEESSEEEEGEEGKED